MRRQLILHLICINLIAAAWIGVLIKVGKGRPAGAGRADDPRPVPEQVGSTEVDDADPALIAEKAALEAEVGDLMERVETLEGSAEAMSRRIQIPKAFFDAPAHFLSPFIEGDTGHKLEELLQMDEAEITAVRGAVDEATKIAQQYESAKLSVETAADGFPVYRVPAWGDFGDKLLSDLRGQLDGILGAERSGYYIDGYVTKEVLRKSDMELVISARPAGGDRPYPSLQVRTVGPETGASGDGDYMVWLTGKNSMTGPFIDRYGHLLGTDSAEELTAKVGALPN
ncbi:MAG: hypothetical protein ACR2RV_08570 [Verrucomicrobiales bacterium]